MDINGNIDPINTKIFVGESMKITKIDIVNIGGIRDLSLEFNEGFNVICGANGTGKTTILDVIKDCFSVGKTINKNALAAFGEYKININDKELGQDERTVKIDEFLPGQPQYGKGRIGYNAKIITFGIGREIAYQRLIAVPKDKQYNRVTGATAVDGTVADDIKGWFVNRDLYSAREGALAQEYLANLEISKRSFGLLEDSVKFSKVDAKSLDIMLSTTKGEIFFEYLSAGFKSCVYIVLGIIKEIEFRNIDNLICAADFDGVVLIDEIDLHLHPTWQAKLMNALKEIFPLAQFIATTHSPSILQCLNKDEIIALYFDENGDTKKKELNLGEYGLQGWTLEEILRDVMEMPSTSSSKYKETIDAFDRAMENEDVGEVNRIYDILDKMLHPQSTLRRLLKIQMVGLGE